ncbi:AAA family ATPase [Arcobacteraceae bacterium]|nr:AAA family ATPase [Arcobacteraceae bacterium]
MFDKISTQANKLVSLTKTLHSTSKTKIVVVTSGKGGVGKSTLTSNMAYLLSKEKKKVVVLDADIGLSNLQVMFNLKPKKTFFDYLEGECELDDILLTTSYHNITLVAGKSGYQYSNINNSMHFSRLVDDIRSLNKYDILLIDTGAGLNEQVQEFIELTDNILAITTTDPSALTDVYALMKMVSLKKRKLMLCFNFTAKYDVGAAITKSLKNLALKNKLNEKFMVQYMGNISQMNSISTTGRLRKLFAKELKQDIASVELNLVVKNLLKSLR